VRLEMDRWGAWGLDFCRNVAYRPWWARLLFWFALGEPGRHEFWGLVWAIQRDGLSAFEPDCEWRSDLPRMPIFWKDKRACSIEEFEKRRLVEE
jgi:hypothetical protein